MYRLGKKRCGWRGPIKQCGRKFIRKVRHVIDVELRHLSHSVPREIYPAAEDIRPNRVQSEFEGCPHAEVSSATTESPEQVCVFPVVSRDELPICRHNVRRDQ